MVTKYHKKLQILPDFIFIFTKVLSENCKCLYGDIKYVLSYITEMFIIRLKCL